MSRVFPGLLLVLVWVCTPLASASAESEVANATALRSAYETAADDAARLDALWRLADVQRQHGQNRAALETLERAAPLADHPTARALTALRTGGVLAGLGRYDEASIALAAAEAEKDSLDPAACAALELELGNVAVERRDGADAARRYAAAMSAAGAAKLPAIEARARVNALRAQLDDKNLARLEPQLASIEAIVATLPAGRTRAELLVSTADLYRRTVNEFDFPMPWRAKAFAALERALASTQDPATLGYAYGFFGALYEDEGRLDEAAAFTARALFQAQQANADAQLYRWEWQSGRLLLAEGRLDDAQDAYARAAEVLDDVKGNYPPGSRNTFNRLVAPVYTQYADVMLARATTLSAGPDKQRLLRGVRDLLETLKQAEVQDYFANQCVVRARNDGGVLHDGTAAVVYPVFLDKRIEILIETQGALAQFTTPVGRNQATQAIRRLRMNLQRTTAADAYLRDAQTLYRWLLAAAEPFLSSHGVRTLVIVPEGALRTVPLAALHDGTRFVVERYAIATTPAIKLTEDLEASSVDNLLIGGLSEAVQGFVGLPNVNREIDAVSSVYPGLTMRDASFNLDAVTQELESPAFSVAHFATHGEFNQDHRKSFILTYDDKLTLNSMQHALEQRGEAPLDLLVLSACETAAGDDRAALGLAGVAVQSGAKSALASLWSISDAASAELAAAFYQALKTPARSKAEALRDAQLALLAEPQFQHPSYWAPYLLIGNWL